MALRRNLRKGSWQGIEGSVAQTKDVMYAGQIGSRLYSQRGAVTSRRFVPSSVVFYWSDTVLSDTVCSKLTVASCLHLLAVTIFGLHANKKYMIYNRCHTWKGFIHTAALPPSLLSVCEAGDKRIFIISTKYYMSNFLLTADHLVFISLRGICLISFLSL